MKNTLTWSLRKVILLVVVSNVFFGCALVQPDIYYWGVKTKRFKNKSYFLKSSDTIGMLSPLAVVKKRVSLTSLYTHQTALRVDSAGQRRERNFINEAIKRYFGNYVTLQKVNLSSEALSIYKRHAEAMFQKFVTDSLVSYRLSDSLIQVLKEYKIRKFLITKIYWEYYDDDLYRSAAAAYSRVGTGYSSGPPNPTIIICYGTIVDISTGRVEYYNSSVFAPNNGGPTGYLDTGESNDFSTKYPGQNYFTNGRIKAVYRKLLRKIHTEEENGKKH
jgi:hypothetical protein